MKKIKRCPGCDSIMEYSTKGNLDRSIRNGSLCRECASRNKWTPETRMKASLSRKIYLSELSDTERININSKISEKNKITYKNKSEEWKDGWKNRCSAISSDRWKDPEYKERVCKSMTANNWSNREDAAEIKKKQVKNRIKNNNGVYSRGPGLCKEFIVEGIVCYGTFEKKYIEILLHLGYDLPVNVKESIITEYGTYTPDFEFHDFFVEVKSKFTYDVLIGKKSYSKSRKSSIDQMNKIIWTNNNVKAVRIAIIDNGTIEYVDV
jgi:hypothetical protein